MQGYMPSGNTEWRGSGPYRMALTYSWGHVLYSGY
jgi:hypothetical protein